MHRAFIIRTGTCFGTAVFLALFLVAGSATAQADGAPCNEETTPENRRIVQELVSDAFDLHKQMRFAETGDMYREAAKRWNRADIHLQAGVAYMSALRLLDAYEHIAEALRCGQAVLSVQDYREAENKMERLRARLAEIEVRVDEPDAEVLINNQPWFYGRDHQMKIVMSGQYVITVQKPGYIKVVEPVVLDSGDRAIVEPVVMTEAEGTILSRRWQGWLPWTIAGAGALTTVAGVVLRTTATSDIDNYETALAELCRDGCQVSEQSELAQQRSDAQRNNTIGISLIGVGAAVIVTGVTMAFLNRQTSERHPDAGKAKLQIVPMLSADGGRDQGGIDGAMLSASGRF